MCPIKKTGVRLELLTDYDQHLMIEQGLRGGIAMISHKSFAAGGAHAPLCLLNFLGSSRTLGVVSRLA